MGKKKKEKTVPSRESPCRNNIYENSDGTKKTLVYAAFVYLLWTK